MERKIKQMWQNVNIWQIWRSSESSRYSSYNSSVVIFFQIKSFEKCPSAESKGNSHITEGGVPHFGKWKSGQVSLSTSLRIVVLSFFSLLPGSFSSV